MNALARTLLAITGLLTGAHLDLPRELAPAAETAPPANAAPAERVAQNPWGPQIAAAEEALADLAEVRRATAEGLAELSEQLGEMALLELEWRTHLADLRERA
ncbi:MAG: hypothetical protein O2816_19925 [Planctomycetota bacterium]|nr:hypothetical protein [Planctomycetota bacterium]